MDIFNGMLVILLLVIHPFLALGGFVCPQPAVPLYAQVRLSREDRVPTTTATYTCDPGYELFGPTNRICHEDGTWDEELPFCGVNVAYRKPSNQSSTVRGGDAKHANDGDLGIRNQKSSCTETKVDNSPWWQVDLLNNYEVRVVRIVTRGCCGHTPLHDLEIRVGNSSVVQGNRLCAWYPGTLGDGISKDFICAYPIIGRYVYVNMVGGQGSLSLCEVFVFTTRELSAGRCRSGDDMYRLTAFNGACYEFQVEQGGSFASASEYCNDNGGHLLFAVDNLVHEFVAAELEHRKDSLKSKLVWLGVRRDTAIRSRTWRWANGDPAVNYMWAEDQPNNYNGQQNCVVLDGGRKWLWNDVTCDLDYLPWICQYTPSTCGSPDREENSTVSEISRFKLGSTITYHCPQDHVALGSITRTCDADGFWSGFAPKCRYIDCGSLPPLPNGKIVLLDGRTTYNASARYVCDRNFTMVGSDLRVCSKDGHWSGREPMCLLSWCPELGTPENGSLIATSNKAGSTARYSCKPGHKLIGNDVRTCELGGHWKGRQPTCLFIECGKPPPLIHGEYILVNQSTTYLSQVIYNCNENFTLVGDHHRLCLENGFWSGQQPLCQLITCGKPGTSRGSHAEVESYNVHSVVRYHCETGHFLSGPAIRTCNRNGTWSGHVPTCKYVDCGRLQPLLKGEVSYANSTTYLDSTIFYTCNSGYSLQGTRVRHCLPNGRWSGIAAKCEEIRCPTPVIPKNATATYTGNDRSSIDSFRVGSAIQYRCIPGNLVQGHPLRTCLPSGIWSGQSPICRYIDCGLPPPIKHGSLMFSQNQTFYGSQADYICEDHFLLSGVGRRLCLENGTWSGQNPMCTEISCGPPETADVNTIIVGDGYHVGAAAVYSCAPGYYLIGNDKRTCLENGFWSGELAFCRAVDCKQPSVVTNGRGFLMNGTTTFASVVQYQCLGEFFLIGDAFRTCLANSKWSGEEPQCVDLALLDKDNAIDSRVSESQTLDSDVDGSKMIIVALAVSAGGLIVLILIIALVCIKTRSKKVKNTENVEVIQPEDKDTTVMSYSRLSLDTNFVDCFSPEANWSHSNGLKTFSAAYPDPPSRVPQNGSNGLVINNTRRARPSGVRS